MTLLSLAGAAVQQAFTEHPLLLPMGSAEHPAKISGTTAKGEVCVSPLDALSHGKVRQRLGWELLSLVERSVRRDHGSSQWTEGSQGVGSKQESAGG